MELFIYFFSLKFSFTHSTIAHTHTHCAFIATNCCFLCDSFKWNRLRWVCPSLDIAALTLAFIIYLFFVAFGAGNPAIYQFFVFNFVFVFSRHRIHLSELVDWPTRNENIKFLLDLRVVISTTNNAKLNGCVIVSFILYIHGVIEIIPWIVVYTVFGLSPSSLLLLLPFFSFSSSLSVGRGAAQSKYTRLRWVTNGRVSMWERQRDAHVCVCVWVGVDCVSGERISSWLNGGEGHTAVCCGYTSLQKRTTQNVYTNGVGIDRMHWCIWSRMPEYGDSRIEHLVVICILNASDKWN